MGYRVTQRELDGIHAACKAGEFARALALITGLRGRMFPDGRAPRPDGFPDREPPPGVLRGTVKEFLNYMQAQSEDALGRPKEAGSKPQG